LLTKESPDKQNFYWRETVDATDPDAIVPVHWDNFTLKLPEDLKPSPMSKTRKNRWIS
jgi:hypothetical protein